MSEIDPFANQKALAARLREVGVSPSYASELSTGTRQPSLELAVRLESELGIPAAAWLGRKAKSNMQADAA